MKLEKRTYPLFMEMHHAGLISMHLRKNIDRSTPIKPVQIVVNQVEVIKKLMEIYQLLCEISILINQHFQLQMLCFSFNTFLNIVFNIYYILIFRGLIANGNSGGLQGHIHVQAMEAVIYFMVISIVGCIMDILCIVCACEHTVNSAKEVSRTVVQKLYTDNVTDAAKEQLTKFALQMIHVFPKFTVFGMFPVDGTLLFTIAGASTTYLIILFQFTQKDSNAEMFENFGKSFVGANKTALH